MCIDLYSLFNLLLILFFHYNFNVSLELMAFKYLELCGFCVGLFFSSLVTFKIAAHQVELVACGMGFVLRLK